MRLIDISEPISPRTAVFPGDTSFRAEWVMRLDRGQSCSVSALTLSPHCGTHADAPLHYDERGEDIAAAELTAYLGRCRVLEVRGRGSPPLVPAEALDAAALAGAERVLLKTRTAHDAERWDEAFTALGPQAAQVLVAARVRLVGIDTPSMDHAQSKDHAAHRVLRTGRVALLENLDLSAAAPGDYELIALPLKIVGGDASPVRAVLRTLS
jgi:arylformamidase